MGPVLLVIIAMFGVSLSWPVFHEGTLALWSGYGPSLTDLMSLFQDHSVGYSRIDGLVVSAAAFCLGITLFIRTTKLLTILRKILIGLVLAALTYETVSAFMQGYAIYTFTGLLFSCLFFFFAFIAALFNFGSQRSFNSTIQGSPMTDTKAATAAVKATFDAAATVLNLKLTALDDVSDTWKSGQVLQWSKPELKLGRDPAWAGISVGPKWNFVSRNHAILKTLSNVLFYQPVSDKSEFSINNKSAKMVTEIPQKAIISLIAGHGPRIQVEYETKRLPRLHVQSLRRAGDIAVQEYKRLQTTLKMFTAITLLGIPLFGVFIGVEHEAYTRFIMDRERKIKDAETEIAQKAQELASMSETINDVTGELSEKNRQLETTSQELSDKARQLSETSDQLVARNREVLALQRAVQNYADEKNSLTQRIKARNAEITRLEQEGSSSREALASARIQAQELGKKLQDLERNKPKQVKDMFKVAEHLAEQIDVIFRNQDIPVFLPIVSVGVGLLTSNADGKSSAKVSVGTGTGFFAQNTAGKIYLITAGHVIDTKSGLLQNVPERHTMTPNISRNYLAVGGKWMWDTRELTKFISTLIDNTSDFSDFDKQLQREGLVPLLDKWQQSSLTYSFESGKKDTIVYQQIQNQALSSRMTQYLPIISTDLVNLSFWAIYGYPDGIRSHAVGMISEVDMQKNLIYGSVQAYHGYSGGPGIAIDPTGKTKVSQRPRVIGVCQGFGTQLKSPEEQDKQSLATVTQYMRFPEGL